VTLDGLSVPPGPLVIKLDVQGAEPFVLQGAVGLLARPQLRLITEFWPHGLVDCQTSPAALLDLLAPHFQHFWALFQDRLPWKVTISQLMDLVAGGLAPHMQLFTDVICLRADDAEGIARMDQAGVWYKIKTA